MPLFPHPPRQEIDPRLEILIKTAMPGADGVSPPRKVLLDGNGEEIGTVVEHFGRVAFIPIDGAVYRVTFHLGEFDYASPNSTFLDGEPIPYPAHHRVYFPTDRSRQHRHHDRSCLLRAE